MRPTLLFFLAFVAATADDRANLLAAMYARRLGARQTIEQGDEIDGGKTRRPVRDDHDDAADAPQRTEEHVFRAGLADRPAAGLFEVRDDRVGDLGVGQARLGLQLRDLRVDAPTLLRRGRSLLRAQGAGRPAVGHRQDPRGMRQGHRCAARLLGRRRRLGDDRGQAQVHSER